MLYQKSPVWKDRPVALVINQNSIRSSTQSVPRLPHDAHTCVSSIACHHHLALPRGILAPVEAEGVQYKYLMTHSHMTLRVYSSAFRTDPRCRIVLASLVFRFRLPLFCLFLRGSWLVFSCFVPQNFPENRAIAIGSHVVILLPDDGDDGDARGSRRLRLRRSHQRSSQGNRQRPQVRVSQ